MIAIAAPRSTGTALPTRRIALAAVAALHLEVNTWPKPGLVSHVDSGSHADMDADTFHASAAALEPFFEALARAGGDDAGMNEMRAIGRAAEQAMLAATGGVNTHRGAIFGLGLLCAAAGHWSARGRMVPAGGLGHLVRQRWGEAIRSGPADSCSHGSGALRCHNAGGARAEAAAGFPSVYQVGLPALRAGKRLAGGEANAARVQGCFALIAHVEDTNLLHRSGPGGLHFARESAQGFVACGGVGQTDWQIQAADIHHRFVARWLSPGGSADLLAATLLIDALEGPASALAGLRGSAR